MDTCDNCGKRRILWHDDRDGLAKCDACLALDVPATGADKSTESEILTDREEDETVDEILGPPALPPAPEPNDDGVLMERETGGVTVQVKYLPIVDLGVLQVRRGWDEMRAATVPLAQLRDAFDHPALYLPDPLTFFK